MEGTPDKVAETKRTHKPSKLATALLFFSAVYVNSTTCIDKCFLLHMITGKPYFLQKFLVALSFFNRPVDGFFHASVLKEVRILYVISSAMH